MLHCFGGKKAVKAGEFFAGKDSSTTARHPTCMMQFHQGVKTFFKMLLTIYHAYLSAIGCKSSAILADFSAETCAYIGDDLFKFFRQWQEDGDFVAHLLHLDASVFTKIFHIRQIN